jgi:Fe-S-cluster-containing hydrogenase component 2
MAYEVNKDKCEGCKTCAGICPVGAISISDKTGKATIDAEKCISCGTCAAVCPVMAIALAQAKSE